MHVYTIILLNIVRKTGAVTQDAVDFASRLAAAATGVLVTSFLNTALTCNASHPGGRHGATQLIDPSLHSGLFWAIRLNPLPARFTIPMHTSPLPPVLASSSKHPPPGLPDRAVAICSGASMAVAGILIVNGCAFRLVPATCGKPSRRLATIFFRTGYRHQLITVNVRTRNNGKSDTLKTPYAHASELLSLRVKPL